MTILVSKMTILVSKVNIFQFLNVFNRGSMMNFARELKFFSYVTGSQIPCALEKVHSFFLPYNIKSAFINLVLILYNNYIDIVKNVAFFNNGNNLEGPLKFPATPLWQSFNCSNWCIKMTNFSLKLIFFTQIDIFIHEMTYIK